MKISRISTLLSLSLITSPLALPASPAAPPSQAITGRSSLRKMKHALATAPRLQPIGTFVGELQEKWKFPSDHLPIGMTFDSKNFLSWNVLDAEYMSWVTEKNSQGLSRSLIADEHVYIDGSKLTVRDKHVVDLLLETISHPTHPRSALCLQECSAPFVKELQSRLPPDFQIIGKEGDIVVIDKRVFEKIDEKNVFGIFSAEPKRSIQEVLLRRIDNQEQIRLINIHLPGDPEKPGRFEFAQYLNRTFDPALTTIATGDMNFNELEMSDALSRAFSNGAPFSLYSPYPTNISPYTFRSKAIDHFMIYSPKDISPTISTPDQIMSELSPIVSLLQEEISN